MKRTNPENGQHRYYARIFGGCRIVVTGGAGFLGSNLVRRLLPYAADIVVIDDLYTGRRDVVPSAPNVSFKQVSVADGPAIRPYLQRADYIFHFAARNIVLSMEQPASDFEVNAKGTMQMLLESAGNIGLRRFVYASTSSIYGNASRLPAEEDQYNVTVPYAASKMCGELLGIAYGQSFGIPFTALRFSNVFGPGQVSTNPYCGVVTKFMERLVRQEPLQIFSDGEQTRDFTYVDDAMDAVLDAAASPATKGSVCNIGTGVETTINELAQRVCAVTGMPDNYPREYVEKRRIDTVQRRAVSMKRLQASTGWRPRHSLDQGLLKTWEWYRQEANVRKGDEA
ncbi:NAD-dependent epimerase/dehydratase family protein [Xylanibacillus composti]|uniref:NDP-sugar dehydratase or epimerase n=1 Tax=Xylanibacillus composti TaxID=1572762 RepID=A0A8J4H417_9BACL|nr:NAD-dependent epimerase/dehydratase family protein [Xylanibacillus composti]GIQ68514.1 NDP-sugar dehydratase or epimerase [Xylanibacillus composti]